MPGRVLFLESHHGVERLFTRGLRSGVRAVGKEPVVLFLRDEAGQPRPVEALRGEIAAAAPERIAFLMDTPLAWPGLWYDARLREIPKAALWYDDFYRCPATMAPEGVAIWKRWHEEARVAVFFHDGWWRGEWERHARFPALPTDLSADAAFVEGGMATEAEALYPELADHAVFLGTVPARAALEAKLASFPPPVVEWIAASTAAMEEAAWPFPAYALADAVAAALPPKRKLILDRWLATPSALALARYEIWRWGKRVARLRGLRALAQRVPVAVLSGHRTEVFAREEELRRELGTGVAFRETTDIPAARWPALFRAGALQVQWLDPQSIESGAPFRMFETAAAGVPLLTDGRPGYPALFAPEREMFYAADEAALADRAMLLMRDREALCETGRRAREAFLARHTWGERWRAIEAASDQLRART
ncbi:Glycosyl transferases group 1 [Verrucomicrobium sp. GAS474]|uniref:glycosyltransferase n=1 Tax=Verrucomicrobium sp. GAS474 TaxID=1882831 RepID=UPI00087DE800|nr:glycosyltransferase [Verrucomicrobium sp. GAS474]SDT89592.1 Glycosyl transferases group 1 [Verrucomicrobium sp. GAS474]